jgi:hypothetical protein
MYYWDPTISGTNGRGAYVSYNMTSGNNVGNPSVVNRYIQPGQAFFVRNTSGVDGSSTLPALSITKDHVVTGTGNRTNIFGRAGTMGGVVVGQDLSQAGTGQLVDEMERIGLSLLLKDRMSSGPADGVVVCFRDDFRDGFGKEDAAKMSNLDENLSAEYGGMSHSILGLSGTVTGMRTDSIPLRMWNLYPGSYVLRLSLRGLDADREVWLYDRSKGRSEQVVGDRLDHLFEQTAGIVRKDDLVLVVHTRVPVARGEGSGGMLLYPNPAVSGRVQFAVPMDGLSASAGKIGSTVEVLEQSGVMVLSRQVELDGRGRGNLDVSGLLPGMYIVRVRLAGGQTFITKMIRQ